MVTYGEDTAARVLKCIQHGDLAVEQQAARPQGLRVGAGDAEQEHRIELGGVEVRGVVEAEIGDAGVNAALRGEAGVDMSRVERPDVGERDALVRPDWRVEQDLDESSQTEVVGR